MKQGKLVLTLTNDGKGLINQKEFDLSKDNDLQMSATSEKPGFRRCVASIIVGGKTYSKVFVLPRSISCFFVKDFSEKKALSHWHISTFKVPPISVFSLTDPTDPTDPTDLLDPSDPSDPSEKPITQITNSRAIPSVKAATLQKFSALSVLFRC